MDPHLRWFGCLGSDPTHSALIFRKAMVRPIPLAQLQTSGLPKAVQAKIVNNVVQTLDRAVRLTRFKKKRAKKQGPKKLGFRKRGGRRPGAGRKKGKPGKKHKAGHKTGGKRAGAGRKRKENGARRVKEATTTLNRARKNAKNFKSALAKRYGEDWTAEDLDGNESVALATVEHQEARAGEALRALLETREPPDLASEADDIMRHLGLE